MNKSITIFKGQNASSIDNESAMMLNLTITQVKKVRTDFNDHSNSRDKSMTPIYKPEKISNSQSSPVDGISDSSEAYPTVSVSSKKKYEVVASRTFNKVTTTTNNVVDKLVDKPSVAKSGVIMSEVTKPEVTTYSNHRYKFTNLLPESSEQLKREEEIKWHDLAQ